MDVRVEGSEIDIDADYVQRIRNLNAKRGFDVESTTKNLRVISEEATETLPDEPPVLEHFDAKSHREGGIRPSPEAAANDSQSNDPLSSVMDATTAFQPPDSPIGVGEKWSRLIPGDHAKRPAARIDFRLTGIEKQSGVQLLHVRFAFRETEGTHHVKSGGYFLIDVRDFSLFEAEATVQNAQVATGTEPGIVNVRLKRAA